MFLDVLWYFEMAVPRYDAGLAILLAFWYFFLSNHWDDNNENSAQMEVYRGAFAGNTKQMIKIQTLLHLSRACVVSLSTGKMEGLNRPIGRDT